MLPIGRCNFCRAVEPMGTFFSYNTPWGERPFAPGPLPLLTRHNRIMMIFLRRTDRQQNQKQGQTSQKQPVTHDLSADRLRRNARPVNFCVFLFFVRFPCFVGGTERGGRTCRWSEVHTQPILCCVLFQMVRIFPVVGKSKSVGAFCSADKLKQCAATASGVPFPVLLYVN